MIAGLISLVIVIVVLGCVFGILLWIVDAVPMPSPYKGWATLAVKLIAALVLILLLLGLIGYGPAAQLPVMRWN